MHLACYAGDVELLRWLLDLQPRLVLPAATQREGWRSEHFAALGGHVPLLEFLQSTGRLDVSSRDKVGGGLTSHCGVRACADTQYVVRWDDCAAT